MHLIFLGGDKRQLEMIKELSKNHDIDVVGYDKLRLPMVSNKRLEEISLNDYDAVIFPVNGVKDQFLVSSEFSDKPLILHEDFLCRTQSKTLIFTGIKTPALDSMLIKAQRDAIALMEDKDVIRENSIPTVEGIVGDLIFNTHYTIKDSQVLVLGYGNIGRPLVELLNYMGALVTVGVIEKRDYDDLNERGIKVIYTDNYEEMTKSIESFQTIINTVPKIILDHLYLKYINHGAYILDIASYPYGIDFDTALEMNLKTKLWSSIPASVAPQTSGKILTKKINKIIGGDHN